MFELGTGTVQGLNCETAIAKGRWRKKCLYCRMCKLIVKNCTKCLQSRERGRKVEKKRVQLWIAGYHVVVQLSLFRKEGPVVVLSKMVQLSFNRRWSSCRRFPIQGNSCNSGSGSACCYQSCWRYQCCQSASARSCVLRLYSASSDRRENTANISLLKYFFQCRFYTY